MAALLNFRERPQDFKRTIKFTQIDGRAAQFDTTLRYRDELEFAALLKDIFSAESDAPQEPGETSEPFDFEASARKRIAVNTRYLLAMLVEWNLEGVEINEDNVRELCVRYPGASKVLMDTYRAAIVEGKAKN